MKPNDLPYLTAGESSMFKRMVDAGRLSFFRLAGCANDGCEESVPRQPESKKYCSKACYIEAEGAENDNGNGQREVD
jgi:hypothetical protein